MVEAEFQIKPEKGAASIDTSTWPLLLKVSPQTTSITTNATVWRKPYEQRDVTQKLPVGRVGAIKRREHIVALVKRDQLLAGE